MGSIFKESVLRDLKQKTKQFIGDITVTDDLLIEILKQLQINNNPYDTNYAETYVKEFINYEYAWYNDASNIVAIAGQQNTRFILTDIHLSMHHTENIFILQGSHNKNNVCTYLGINSHHIVLKEEYRFNYGEDIKINVIGTGDVNKPAVVNIHGYYLRLDNKK